MSELDFALEAGVVLASRELRLGLIEFDIKREILFRRGEARSDKDVADFLVF